MCVCVTALYLQRCIAVARSLALAVTAQCMSAQCAVPPIVSGFLVELTSMLKSSEFTLRVSVEPLDMLAAIGQVCNRHFRSSRACPTAFLA